MNESIPVSAFPKYMDDQSAHFLLIVAEKDLELEKCEARLSDLRKDIRSRRSSTEVNSSTELVNTVRKRLKDLSQSSIGIPCGKDNNAQNTNEFDSTLERKSSTNYNEISELRSKITQIHEFVKETTTQEIKRVTDLYQINAGVAGEVGLFHVIRSLVGDRVREFNRYTRSSFISPKNRISLMINY